MDGLPARLTPGEERALLDRMARGDRAARNALIEHNLRLVMHIATHYQYTRIPLEDLFSIGCIGLIKAVDAYKPGKGARLSTFIARCAANEILMAARKERPHVQDFPLDMPLCVNERSKKTLSIADLLTSDDPPPDTRMVQESLTTALYDVLATLPERWRALLTVRYGLGGAEPMAQGAAGKIVGISQAMASRAERAALNQCRAALIAQGQI